MPDLQRVLPDYDPLDQQLQDPLPLHQVRLVEPGPHSLAERFDVRPHRLRCPTLVRRSLLLVALRRQDLAATTDLFAADPQLLQVDDLGLVGVDQTSLLAVEPLQLGLPPPGCGAIVVR